MIWGFPKIRDTFQGACRGFIGVERGFGFWVLGLRFPNIKGTLVGLRVSKTGDLMVGVDFGGPLILGNYHLEVSVFPRPLNTLESPFPGPHKLTSAFEEVLDLFLFYIAATL